MTTKQLDLSANDGKYTVTFDVKGWTNVEGGIKVTPSSGIAKTITYTKTRTESFETKSVDFTGGTSSTTITIATSAKRAFIDNIVITQEAVDNSKKNPLLAYSASSLDVTIGDDAISFPSLTVTEEDGVSATEETLTIEYSSTDSDVAFVDEAGVVTIGTKTGSTTITATSVATEIYNSASASYTINVSAGTLNGIEDLVAQVRADNSLTAKEYTVNLENAVVTAVAGSNAYIQESEVGILYYKSGHDLVVGNTYTGEATVTACMYSLSPEITSISGVTATSGTVPEAVEVTVQDLNDDISNQTYNYIARKVKIVGATVTAGTSSRKATVEQSGASIDVYDQLNNSDEPITLTNGNTVSITGYLSISGSKARFNVVAQSDVEVISSKEVPVLSFSSPTVSVTLGEEFTSPTLTKPEGLVVTYSSSEPTVATVDPVTGAVSILAAGTTTIKAETEETVNFYAGSASYVLTVTVPVGMVDGYYYLVKSIDDLVAGARYLIANNTVLANNTRVSLIGWQDKNNRRKVEATCTDDKNIITEVDLATEDAETNDSKAREFVLGGTKGAWTFFDELEGGYLYAAGGAKDNYLRTDAVPENNDERVDVTIDDEGATSIKFVGKSTHNIMQYNSSNNGLFACYISASQKPVVLYRKYDTAQGEITIPDYGYSTYYTENAFVMPQGLKGGVAIATADNTLKIQYAYNGGDIVPAKTALLLKGAAGKYAYDITTGGVAPDVNMLHGADAVNAEGYTDVDGESSLYYVFANNNGNLGFYWAAADGAAVKYQAGKAFLAVPKVSGAKLFSSIVFDDDETTGIEAVETVKPTDAAVYTLMGVRVGNDLNTLPKGLYIQNGKKVLVK